MEIKQGYCSKDNPTFPLLQPYITTTSGFLTLFLQKSAFKTRFRSSPPPPSACRWLSYYFWPRFNGTENSPPIESFSSNQSALCQLRAFIIAQRVFTCNQHLLQPGRRPPPAELSEIDFADCRLRKQCHCESYLPVKADTVYLHVSFSWRTLRSVQGPSMPVGSHACQATGQSIWHHFRLEENRPVRNLSTLWDTQNKSHLNPNWNICVRDRQDRRKSWMFRVMRSEQRPKSERYMKPKLR